MDWYQFLFNKRNREFIMLNKTLKTIFFTKKHNFVKNTTALLRISLFEQYSLFKHASCAFSTDNFNVQKIEIHTQDANDSNHNPRIVVNELKDNIDNANKYFDELKYKEAFESYSNALKISLSHFPESKEQIANIYLKIGYCLMYENQPEASSQNIMNGLKIIVDLFGVAHKRTAETVTMLGTLNFFCNRFEQAQANFKMALDIYSKIDINAEDELGSIFKMQGNINEKIKKNDLAINSYEQALQKFEQNSDKNIVNIYEIKRDLAYLYQKEGKYEKSYGLAQQAYEIMATKLDKDTMALALLQERLGENAFELNQKLKAAEHFEIAEKHYATILPSNSVKLAELKLKQDLLK